MRLIALMLLAAATTPVSPARAETAAEALARGDAAWARRADGFAQSHRANADAASEALAAYEAAVAADPSSLEARIRLERALWFHGHFVETPAQAKKTFERLATLAEETVRVAEAPAGDAKALGALKPPDRAARISPLPFAKDAHFWAGVAWGLWALSHGNAAAGAKGVAGKIRDHAEIVTALDDRFMDGGGPRLLGRLHAEAPRVPLFTRWIDRSRGIAMLERAHSISTADPRNALFLGEALLKYAPDRRAEAIGLLREAARDVPDPGKLVEQQENVDDAKKDLESLGEAP